MWFPGCLYRAYYYAMIMYARADFRLLQHLEQFHTLPLQYRHIEHIICMKEFGSKTILTK